MNKRRRYLAKRRRAQKARRQTEQDPAAHYYEQCPALRGVGHCDCAEQAATDLYDSSFPEF